MGGSNHRQIRTFASLIAVLLAIIAIVIMDEKQGGLIFLGFLVLGIVLDIIWRKVHSEKNPKLDK